MVNQSVENFKTELIALIEKYVKSDKLSLSSIGYLLKEAEDKITLAVKEAFKKLCRTGE